LGILDAGENVRRQVTRIHGDDERLLALELQNIASVMNELHSALYDLARTARAGADTRSSTRFSAGGSPTRTSALRTPCSRRMVTFPV
jgi:hypothetical protein